MENTLILTVLIVSAVSLAISIYLAIKIKAVHYLLEQPVIKKMSPQLKLKPVKLDELMAERSRQQHSQNREPRQGGNQSNPRQGGRPQERNDQERRNENRNDNRGDRQDRRPERNDGPRPERTERPEGDRSRNPEGDRNRNSDRNRNRGDRPDRQGGGDRGDRRPRETFENREPAAAPVQHSEPVQPVVRSEAPAAPISHEAPLSPRRPLTPTVEVENNHNPISISSSGNEGQSEVFAGSDNDVQHGRRTQLKKKPRFELDEAEVKTEG